MVQDPFVGIRLAEKLRREQTFEETFAGNVQESLEEVEHCREWIDQVKNYLEWQEYYCRLVLVLLSRMKVLTSAGGLGIVNTKADTERYGPDILGRSGRTKYDEA